jgi:hypothetical protein
MWVQGFSNALLSRIFNPLLLHFNAVLYKISVPAFDFPYFSCCSYGLLKKLMMKKNGV